MIAKPQSFGDPGIAEPVGDELEHLAFSLAQDFQSGRSGRASLRLKMLLGHDRKEAQSAIPVLDDRVPPLGKMQSRTRNKILDDRRCQYLAGRSQRSNTLGNVERAASDRIIQNGDFACMHADRKIECGCIGEVPQRHRAAQGAHCTIEPGAEFGARTERTAAVTRPPAATG